MTEEEIIRAIVARRSDQEAAMRALYVKGAEFRRYFMSSKYRLSLHEAEDVLQDTIVKIFRSATSFSGGGGFGDASANAWMWQIAKNCLMDRLRKNKDQNLDLEGLEIPSGNKVTDLEKGTQIYRNETRQIDAEECVSVGLEEFAAEYPDRARVLEMQMDGQSIESIAAQIGRNVGATKEFLSQCKKKLAPFIRHCLDLLAP